jgi:hypothetical protein
VRIEQVQNSTTDANTWHPADWGNRDAALQVLPLLCVPALAAQGGVQVPKGRVGACRRRLTTLCDCVQANQASDHEATKVKLRFKR